MKMNKIYKSLGLLLALSLFSSCYKDHSVNGDHPLAVVKVTEPIASVQTATFGEVTVIKSPAYTITTGASVTPSYEWIVDGVVVSTEKDLSYSPTSYGKHDARLRMYTPDGSYFYRFTIDVPYRYVDGLYVLASNEGKTILSYLSGGEKTDAFDLDAFGRSNPTIDMTGDPQSMFFYRYVPGAGASRSYLGIALGLPTRYYRVSADSLKVLSPRISFTNPVDFSHASGNQSTVREYFISGANVWELEKTGNIPAKKHDRYLSPVAPGYSLASAIVNWRALTGTRISEGMAFFDNAGSNLLYMILGSRVTVKKVRTLTASSFPGGAPEETNPFEGMTLIDMKSGGEGNFTYHYTLLLLKRNSDSKYFVARLRAGDFAGTTTLDEAAVSLVEFTEGTPTHLMPNLAGTAALVATADKVYFYNMANTTATDHPAWISLPSGQTIASMALTTDNRLFIGANGTGSGLVGSIYSYDVTGITPQLIKAETGVTGKIKQIIYRQFSR